MDQIKFAVSLVPTFVTSSFFLALALWKADTWISDAGAKRLYAAINQVITNPRDSEAGLALETFLNHYFSYEIGWAKFLKNVLILTLASLIFFLCIYVTKVPELYSQILTEGFLTQFFGNGFFVTYATNCFVFSQYKHLIHSFTSKSVLYNIVLVGIDILTKAIVYALLTLLTYYAFAFGTGAFGGNIHIVPNVVATTILQALRFQNLTAVYLYSLVLSSLPIFVIIVTKIMVASPSFAKAIQAIFFWLPFEAKPLRAIAVVFSVLAGMFSIAFVVTLSWLT